MFSIYILKVEAEKTTDPNLSRYRLIEKIGWGAFATVQRCIEKKSLKTFAMKCIDKKKCSYRAQKEGEREKSPMDEIDLMRKLNHRNIIKIHDHFETDSRIFIVMELVTGKDLLDRMILMGHEFTETQARVIFLQLLDAVSYLHRMGIVHRDLKPENILMVTEDSIDIKLTDFGLSRLAGEDSFMQTICGTPMYIAPEVIAAMNQKKSKKAGPKIGYTNAVDIWAMGVLLFILLCNEAPFDIRRPRDILEQIQTGSYTYLPEIEVTLSSAVKDLIKRLLTVDPLKRITHNELSKHAWVTGAYLENEPKNIARGITIPRGKKKKTITPLQHAMSSINLEQGFQRRIQKVSSPVGGEPTLQWCADFRGALREGDLEAVAKLLKDPIRAKVDLAALLPDSAPALTFAVQSEKLASVKYMVEEVGVEVDFPDLSPLSPLFMAADMGLIDIGRYLIEKGANVNRTNHAGYTPLIVAALRGQREFVSLLLEQKNIDVNAVAPLEHDADVLITPLFGSIISNSLSVAEVLVEVKADVNHEIKACGTLFIAVAEMGRLDFVQLFLEKGGANINATDKDEETAFMCAAAEKRYDVVEYLVSMGAQTDVKASNLRKLGFDPRLDQAIKEGTLRRTIAQGTKPT